MIVVVAVMVMVVTVAVSVTVVVVVVVVVPAHDVVIPRRCRQRNCGWVLRPHPRVPKHCTIRRHRPRRTWLATLSVFGSSCGGV